jgi:hypothetical protein
MTDSAVVYDKQALVAHVLRTCDTRTAKSVARIALSLEPAHALERAPSQHAWTAKQLAASALSMQLRAGDTAEASVFTSVDALHAHGAPTLARIGAALKTLHGVPSERMAAAQFYLLLSHRAAGEQREYARQYLEHCVGARSAQPVQATLDDVVCHMTQADYASVAREVAAYVRDAHPARVPVADSDEL